MKWYCTLYYPRLRDSKMCQKLFQQLNTAGLLFPSACSPLSVWHLPTVKEQMTGVIRWKAQVANFHWSIVHEIGNHPEKPVSICTVLGKTWLAWESCFRHLLCSGHQTGGHQTQGAVQKRDTLIESLGIRSETACQLL